MLPRPFFVRPYFECPIGTVIHERLPPHRLIVEPLLRAASEVIVFGPPAADAGFPLPPHRREGQRLRLELTAEVVRGWERFWNSGCTRGAVALQIPDGRLDWGQLFYWTEYGGVWSSRYQIRKGTPASAINYCDQKATGSTVVACFSASNGIEHLDIWADESTCQELDELAQQTCRHFVRECEEGKFEREIVYNLPAYREMI